MAAFALARVEEPTEVSAEYDAPPPRIEEDEWDIFAFELWHEGCCAGLELTDEAEETR